MLSQLVDDFRSRVKSSQRLPRFATLTQREKEVLKLLAEGNSVKEIACTLDLSVKTVEAHKFNLMRKLDIHNKAQLVQYAVQKKVIKIPVPGVCSRAGGTACSLLRPSHSPRWSHLSQKRGPP